MTTLRLLASPGFRTDQCSWYSFRTCWHLRLFSGLHLSQAFSEALTKIYFSAIDIKSTTLLRRVMFYWGNMRGLLEAARNILASLQKFTWMHIICWTVHKWFTEGFTGFSVVGCLSRLHWENAQCTAQHKLTLQCDINNNRVEKLPGIVFSYETIPPPPLSRAENNWNLGQWGTQGRRGSQHFSTDRHLNLMTIVKQKQLVCTGLSLLDMLLIRSIMTSTITLTAIKFTLTTNCSIMKSPIYVNGVRMMTWLIKFMWKHSSDHLSW